MAVMEKTQAGFMVRFTNTNYDHTQYGCVDWSVSGTVYEDASDAYQIGESQTINYNPGVTKELTITYPKPFSKPPKLYAVNASGQYYCSYSITEQNEKYFKVKLTNRSDYLQYDSVYWTAIDADY